MSTKAEKAPAVPGGIKIHELAKEIGIPSKELLEKAIALGIPKLKSHASVLTPGQADRLRAKLGGGKKLKADLEENKTRLSKRSKAAKGEDPGEEPGEEAVETAPAAETAVAEEEVTEPAAEAPVQEEPPVVETAASVEETAAETEAPPAEEKEKKTRFGVVVTAAQATVPPPAPTRKGAPPQPLPSLPAQLGPLTQPPKRSITAGPDVAPPIQRPAAKVDPRFGVVTPATEADKLQGPTKGRPAARSAQVESKAVDDFKPQVSYPVIPEGSYSTDDEGRKSAATRGLRGRGPVRGGPGMKGFGGGPRRGVALMRGDDDSFRGARRPKHRPMLQKPVAPRVGPAEVTSPVSIKSLCEALSIKSNELVRKFMEQGKLVTINSILSEEDAMLYALEFDPLKFGISIKKARDAEEELLKAAEVPDKPDDLIGRAPVVTIMGHVDHGKTSLLDYVRSAKVAAGEAGGITQHIGAYKVHHKKGDITFLDTPGHKAFTEMRARGANVTDIVVLVVAANDGVMPQTEEAISHAKQASKKIVVAMNKIDLPEANADKVRGQLASKELFVEGYGGEVGCVEVSAKTGKGIDDLLDRILLEAEVLELKANPDKHAVGTVVEAHKDQGRGIVCTLLVQEGTLQHGDVIICGHAYGTVRQVLSDTGKPIAKAGPSTPVLITGLNDVPLAGERFHVLDSIKEAAEIAETRAMRMRQEGLVTRQHVTLETLSDMLAQGAVAALKLVLKVDVMGSLVPLRNELAGLTTGEAKIDILHDGVGAINETDVLLADASDAIVIGFNVTADPNARRMAEERGVEIRSYNIIYEIVDEVRKALEGMLKPIEKEVVQGHATVRQTFKISKIGTIAGCFVNDGLIQRNSQVRLIRDSKPVWNGKLASLKRVKDDAKEVRSGFECGIKLDGYDDIKEGDTIEAFTMEQVKRTLA